MGHSTTARCSLRMAATILLASVIVNVALAADDPSAPSNAELLKELQAMKKRISFLEQELRKQKGVSAPRATAQPPGGPRDVVSPSPASTPPAPPPTAQALPAAAPPETPPPAPANRDLFGLIPSPVAGLKIGTYGEFNFGYQQNPAANGQWQLGADLARLVLLPSYKFTDNIVFNAEIEFEHAGTAFDNDDKLHGTAEIEQAYVDFLISPNFNFRAPGIDLVPVGYTNLYHEPTLFYSVRRPEIPNGLGNGLIPTTWASPAMSIHGKIVDNLNYQFQISSSLEDFGDAFDQRTPANSAPPGPYMAGIDSITGLDFSTPPRGGFAQLTNELGYAGRLSYTPPFIPGLAGSTSLYFSPNIEPRGAHAGGGGGRSLGRTTLSLLDTEIRYRIPQTGFELRGEAAGVFFGNPANLRANNDGDPTNNLGNMMVGLSPEIAYHIPLGSALGGDWEAVPFFRYSYLNRFAGKYSGTDLNEPSGAGRQHYYTVGVAVFPTPELVLKLDYQHITDSQPGGPKSDSVLGSVGWFF
jgi:hypothetical protein